MTAPGPQDRTTREVALNDPIGFLAFGFGSGLSPRAPGTAGTALGLLLALPLVGLPIGVAAILVALAFLVGVPICSHASRALGVHDHGGIVWDEFVGLWLVLLFVPATPVGWLAAFVAFRFFDIVKPWPIGWLDRRITGGLGIMVDDVVAGLYAIGVITLIDAGLERLA